MEKLFRIHQDIGRLDFKKIWQEGVFIFDSNVLLDLYRLPKSAQEDLLGIFRDEDFGKRIWIGFQVILEFLNNRLEVIGDQKNKFHSVQVLVNDAIKKHNEIFETLNIELNKLKLKQRHSLIDPDNFITTSNIENSIFFLHDFISNLNELEIKQSDVTDNDEIMNFVIEIFKSKIGSGFDKVKLDEIYKEGEKRYASKIPPGYKDSEKKGSHLYEDKEYIRKFGDLILWKEVIEKAKNENLKYLILVTGDVKEDWWLEKRGKKIGPRLELLNEIYSEAPNLITFHMYDTASFLKYAKIELNLKVKDSSIEEAGDLIELSREPSHAFSDNYGTGRIDQDNSIIDGFQVSLINNIPVVAQVYTAGESGLLTAVGLEMENAIISKNYQAYTRCTVEISIYDVVDGYPSKRLSSYLLAPLNDLKIHTPLQISPIYQKKGGMYAIVVMVSNADLYSQYIHSVWKGNRLSTYKNGYLCFSNDSVGWMREDNTYSVAFRTIITPLPISE